MLIICITLVLYLKLNKKPSLFLRETSSIKSKSMHIKLPNFKFINRFRLRVIIQNIGNYTVLFIGIIFANFILAFGLSLVPMIDNYSKLVSNASIADYQYVIRNNVVDFDEEGVEKYGIKEFKYINSKEDVEYDLYLYGIEQNTIYLDSLSLLDDNIYISSALSKKINLKIGDTLLLDVPFTTNQKEFVINKIFDYPTFALFTSLSNFNSINGYEENYYNGFFSNKELNIAESNLILKILSSDYIKAGDQMLSTFGDFAPFCLVVFILFQIIILYLLTKMVIDKNKKNISLLKIIGYEEKDIRKVYITSTTLVVIVSTIISLPIAKVIMQLMVDNMFKKINGYILSVMPIYIIILCVVSTLIIYYLINIANLNRIKKVNFNYVLKTNE
jgi:putative ABC transport system permease protein